MAEDVATKRRSNRNWLLWWIIDPVELEMQVSQYATLKFYKSARGISLLCTLVSAAITILLIAFKTVPIEGLFDIVVLAIFGLFIYLGHRWASVAAMLLWTLEKVVVITGGIGASHPNAGLVIGQVIWWCIFMNAFYRSFRVEQRRKTMKKTPDTSVF